MNFRSMFHLGKYKHENSLLEIGNSLFFSILVFSVFLFFHQEFIWDVFSVRDIERALAWLKGDFYWLGPEMSDKGNLPGPFLYLLLIPPLLLGDSTYNHMDLWRLIWLSLTYIVSFYFVSNIIKHKESILIFLLFFLSGIYHYDTFLPITEALNPLFAIMFHILALISIYFWRQTDQNHYLYWTAVIIALGIQIHLLVSVHALTVFLFYCFKKNRKLTSILLFSFIASSPFLIYFIMNHFYNYENFVSLDRHFYFLKEGLFSERWFKYVKSFFSLPLISSFIALCFFAFSLVINFKRKKFKWPIKKSTIDLFIIIAIPSFVIFIESHRYWYGHPVLLFFMIFLSKFCDDLMPKKSDQRLNFSLAYGVLLLSSVYYDYKFNPIDFYREFFSEYSNSLLLFFIPLIVLFVINSEFSKKKLLKLLPLFVFVSPIGTEVVKWKENYEKEIPNSFHTQWISQHNDLALMMREIFFKNGWPPKEAEKKIFTVLLDPEQSLFSLYSMVWENLKEKKGGIARKLPAAPDGYLIFQHIKRFQNYSHKNWKEYLSHSSLLANSLREEIRQNKIQIDTPEFYNSYWLIPYRVTKNSMFVEGFTNRDQPYYWEEPDWLKNCVHTKTFKKVTGGGRDFYYCMILPGYLQRAGVHIKFSEDASANSLNSIFINFFGPMIGSITWVTNEGGIALWSDIEFSFTCNDRIYNFTLPNVGSNLSIRLIRRINKMAKMLFTPLKLRIPVPSPCQAQKIKEINLTFFQNHSNKELSGNKKITWKNN